MKQICFVFDLDGTLVHNTIIKDEVHSRLQGEVLKSLALLKHHKVSIMLLTSNTQPIQLTNRLNIHMYFDKMYRTRFTNLEQGLSKSKVFEKIIEDHPYIERYYFFDDQVANLNDVNSHHDDLVDCWVVDPDIGIEYSVIKHLLQQEQSETNDLNN